MAVVRLAVAAPEARTALFRALSSISTTCDDRLGIQPQVVVIRTWIEAGTPVVVE